MLVTSSLQSQPPTKAKPHTHTAFSQIAVRPITGTPGLITPEAGDSNLLSIELHRRPVILWNAVCQTTRT